MRHLLFSVLVILTIHSSQSAPDFCKEKPDPGEGSTFSVMVYYDPEKDQCSPFLFNGQKGNGNRFEHERECIRNCSDNAERIYPVDQSNACTFKKSAGGCDGKFLRFYYDPIHDKCKKFFWTGCLGNGNRFFDSTSCNATCVGIHEDGDEDEEDEPDTPIAIICGVLIGLIVVAIVATVVFLTVRSKKKKSSKSKGKRKDVDTPLQDRGTEIA